MEQVNRCDQEARMMRRTVLRIARRSTVLIANSIFALAATTAVAEVLFESGTLGQTGVSWSDVFSQAVPGTNINASVFTGVRFQLDHPVRVTKLGGHFVAPNAGTFFGAIVKLDSNQDFPDSGDLSTPDVLLEATLTFPTLSGEVYGALDGRLEPGSYSLVFGTGLFGTAGAGAALRNNTDVGTPAYVAHQPVTGWFNLADLSPVFVNHRFAIQGSVVPEPSAIALICLVGLPLIMVRRRILCPRTSTDSALASNEGNWYAASINLVDDFAR